MDEVDKELQRLQRGGTIEPVDIAEWAAPIVVVQDKQSVWICGDFSMTINPVSKLDHYPIPRVEDLFAGLSGGKYSLNLTSATLTNNFHWTRIHAVINTHRGLFRFTRLPFGIFVSAWNIPASYRELPPRYRGSHGLLRWHLSHRKYGGESSQSIRWSAEWFKADLRVKQKKCAFMRPSVIYLGHRIDAQGLHPLQDRIRAIQEVPKLKSYLGMLSYYSKFLPKVSTVLHSLHLLLWKDVTWKWGVGQAKAFAASKELLTSESCLSHLDSSLELILAHASA